jgi:hypothetical protein
MVIWKHFIKKSVNFPKIYNIQAGIFKDRSNITDVIKYQVVICLFELFYHTNV